MEPSHKAKELIEKFGHYTKFYNDRTESIDVNLDDAKQCALICVGEILKEFPTRLGYWVQVEEEITKL